MLLPGRTSARKECGKLIRVIGSDKSFRMFASGIRTRFMKLICSKHKTCLTLFQTFGYAVVHFGDIPADCIGRVVGHYYSILFERPEVTLNDLVIHADFRSSGDRLLDQDNNKEGRFYQVTTKMSWQRNYCSTWTSASSKRNPSR